MTDHDAFRSSLNGNHPPAHLSPLLKALWHDGKGEWEAAHELAQEVNTSDGSWVHAYLHRKEGDTANARYWYSRAGRSMPSMSLPEEWEFIIRDLLKRS